MNVILPNGMTLEAYRAEYGPLMGEAYDSGDVALPPVEVDDDRFMVVEGGAHVWYSKTHYRQTLERGAVENA